MEIDLTEAVSSRTRLPVSEAGVVARIIAGGVVGAVGGMLAGGLVYGSLVVGLFGAIGGGVVGMIGALKGLETR